MKLSFDTFRCPGNWLPLPFAKQLDSIKGALGTTGPNIGKAVTVGQCQGEHSVHGRIWRVHGEGLVTEYGATGSELDCAAAWLRKIEPPPGPKTKWVKDLSLTS